MTATVTAPARILVVEDESIVALDLRSSLEQLGYEVVGTAATAADAISLAEKKRPDLVLMDIRLRGETDGTVAADQIRRRLGLPVVYLTAYSDSATLQRAQVSEPYGYLLKPFADRDLQVTIQMALYRHRAQREHEALLREQAARVVLERDQRWTRFLVDATAELSASLDVHRTQTILARLMVPEVADWAAVHVKGAEETVAVAHARGDEERLWSLLKRYPPGVNLLRGYPYVLRTGEPDLVPNVTTELLRQIAVDKEHLALLEGLELRSWLCLPITIRSETYGAIWLVMTDSERHFEQADVERLMELARRGGMAIENARLYQLAQEAVAVREEFLSVAAHELRTPLSAILLTLFGLQRMTKEPKLDAVHKKIGHIIQQFDRLTALIDRLLDVSRIRAGKLEIHIEEADLAQIVRDVTGRFAEAASRADCQVTIDAPPSVRGSFDQVRIEQVLINLLGNAIKFCAHKPIKVSLTAEHETAHLAIQDSGEGIAPDRLPFIFERFERGVSARNYGGLGLGLYVTRQIVEAHGGSIEAESELGNGSTFRVRLPLRVRAPGVQRSTV